MRSALPTAGPAGQEQQPQHYRRDVLRSALVRKPLVWLVTGGVALAALIMVVVLVAVAGGGPDATDAAPPGPDASTEAAARASAVLVEADGCSVESEGMGMVVPPGVVVTNAHVVAGASEIRVRDDSGRTSVATLTAFDPERDIAVLEAGDLTAVPMALGAPAGGTPAIVLARSPGPNDGDVIEALETEVIRTITIFISDIYGDGRYERRGLELAVDIEPGDSGAAVVDGSRRVVGLVFSSSRGKPGVAYAVSALELDDLIESRSREAIAPGRCRRP